MMEGGIAPLALAVSGAWAADCGSLAGKAFGAAQVTAATSVSPPSSVVNIDFPTGPVAISAPFCRVQGTIKPSADSDIKFEVWLPAEGAWNGKYEGVGNGGFAGSLLYPAMAWALQGGYAVSATDTGHPGSALDAGWAFGHPEKITDFGWRGIHETAAASKGIVEAYYGKAPAHAYFTGCSDGGREALMEAQRFPQDYDGIVAGAPANFWTSLLSNGLWTEQAISRPESWLSPEKVAVVSKAVLAACHGEGGYLEDPSRCHFDPSSLVCKAGQTDACLTDAEAVALRKVYSGAEDAAGRSIFPGFAPGGEADPGGWVLWVTGTEPKRTTGTLIYGFVTGYFRDMVFDKPNWRLDGQGVSDDLAAAVSKTGEAVDSANPDLSAFRAAGGKLIQYHGWSDAAIPPQSSINYYQEVAAKMGGTAGMQSFYRLFMAPGMDHCGGGPGPDAVGGVFGMAPPARDPAHDVVAALARWVEDGAAPDQVIATKYREGDSAKGIEAQRPWCPYPATAAYSGQGDRKEAASYACATTE
jgi:feruloyl esterase